MLKSSRMAVLLLLVLLLSGSSMAQENSEAATDIHKNVRLIEMPVPQNMPEEFRAKYQLFLNQLKDAIKEKTSERAPSSAFTFQVHPTLKEVGAKKTIRPVATVVAFKKDSKSEYRGDIPLNSYLTGQTISREEIDQFLTRQIIAPLEME